MKFKIKILIFFLVLFNFYFFSFFAWYAPGSGGSYFIDIYSYTPGQGPYAATFYTPRGCNRLDTPAGSISRTISSIYAPLAWYWEKRGVGYFFPDEYSIVNLSLSNDKTLEDKQE